MKDNVKNQNQEIKTKSNSTEFQAEELDKRYEMYGPPPPPPSQDAIGLSKPSLASSW